MEKACVFGSGGWGTALAQLLAEKGYNVAQWVREPEVADEINGKGTNSIFLPEVQLSEKIRACTGEEEVLDGAGIVLLVIPTQHLRSVVVKVRDLLPVGVPLVNCGKGIERGSLALMSEVLTDELPGKYHPYIAHLSGPSFAKEVARGMPANVTVASASKEAALSVQAILGEPKFRVYTSTDVAGVLIGGAIKNVIAIASGACDGLGFGLNARASLITRGLAEMTRLAAAMGANPLTLAGHAGVGDLVLTCTGDLSRNHMVGFELGLGKSLEEIIGSMRMVAEGVETSRSTWQLSRKLDIEMPITEQVYTVLHEGKPVRDAAEYLMSRTPKDEVDPYPSPWSAKE